jgi:hypothetical protein
VLGGPRDDKVQRLSERLVGPVTEDPLGSRVPHADDPVAVCRHYRIRGSSKNGVGSQSSQFHSHCLFSVLSQIGSWNISFLWWRLDPKPGQHGFHDPGAAARNGRPTIIFPKAACGRAVSVASSSWQEMPDLHRMARDRHG